MKKKMSNITITATIKQQIIGQLQQTTPPITPTKPKEDSSSPMIQAPSAEDVNRRLLKRLAQEFFIMKTANMELTKRVIQLEEESLKRCSISSTEESPKKRRFRSGKIY